MRTRVFIDGACSGNPGSGGWAAVIFLLEGRIVLTGHEKSTTNNRMELMAAVEALKTAIKVKAIKVDVYSDSAYVVNAIKNKWVKKWSNNGWKTVHHEDIKNKDLWLQILSLLNFLHDVNFIKVKGHTGDINNEMVDRMAKREATQYIDNVV